MAKVTDDGREKYSSSQTIGIIMKHVTYFNEIKSWVPSVKFIVPWNVSMLIQI